MGLLIHTPPLRIRPYAVLTAVGWTLFVLALYVSGSLYLKAETEKAAQAEARAHFNKDLAFRFWATSHGGVYVPVDPETPPNPYLHVAERDIVSPSGVPLTLMDPAYMLREMQERFADLYGVRGHITSTKPLRPENAPDEWERRALLSFESGVKEVNEFTEIDGKPFLRLIRPMITVQGCLKCHEHQGYREGDIQGGVGVSLPMDFLLTRERNLVKQQTAAFGLLWLLGLCGIGFGFRRLEEQAFEREQSFSILRSALDGLSDCVLLIGPDYRVQMMNQAALATYGDPADSEYSFCHQITHHRDTPCGSDGCVCPLREVQATLSTVRVTHENFMADGNLRTVEVSCAPVFSKSGALEGFVESIRDVTERKRFDEILARRECILEAVAAAAECLLHTSSWEEEANWILEQIGVAAQASRVYLFRCEDAGSGEWIASQKFEWAAPGIEPQIENPALTELHMVRDGFSRWVDHHTRGDIICGPTREFPPDEQSTLQPQEILSLLVVPIHVKCQWWGFLGFDECTRERVWETVEIEALRTAATILGAAIERLQAEEERHHLQAQVQHTQKLESLGVLAGGIAHDFNNLLMGILGYAGLALDEVSPESPARSTLLQIEKAARRAAELTKQLLAYSGKGRFFLEPQNLSGVVEEMVDLLKVSIAKNAILKLHLLPHVPSIKADGAQIRQIIMNLITNASDAIGDQQGIIRVRTAVEECKRETVTGAWPPGQEAPEGAYVLVEVSDTGCGMSAETLERIFDPFFTTKFTGRGLGLAAVLGIIRGHNGFLNVVSQPGAGTTFTVYFPALAELAVHESSKPGTVPAFQGAGVVLIVDDDETIRMLTSQILGRTGFTILTAEDGLQGLAEFDRNRGKISLILLDMTMPGLSGEETYNRIRKVDPSIPILLSSGYDALSFSADLAKDGRCGFIQKPYTPTALLDVVRSLLPSADPGVL